MKPNKRCINLYCIMGRFTLTRHNHINKKLPVNVEKSKCEVWIRLLKVNEGNLRKVNVSILKAKASDYLKVSDSKTFRIEVFSSTEDCFYSIEFFAFCLWHTHAHTQGCQLVSTTVLDVQNLHPRHFHNMLYPECRSADD